MKDPFSPDRTIQPVVKGKLSEKEIQEACVAYARSKGFWARKFSSMSQRAVPDYLFSKRYGSKMVVWAEEFKAEGKQATKAQLEEQDKMIAAGWTVYPETGYYGQDDIEEFKRRIDFYEKTYGS